MDDWRGFVRTSLNMPRVRTQRKQKRNSTHQLREANEKNSLSPSDNKCVEDVDDMCTSGFNRKSLRLQQDSDASFDDLLPFIRLTWDVHRVSPLFGFELTEVRLKQYSLRLRDQFVCAEMEENVNYYAQFGVLQEVSKNENDICITIKVSCSREEENTKTIYDGALLSWGSPEENVNERRYLPLLLCRGKISVKQLVHGALQTLFDCVVSPFHLTQMDLIWLNGLFASTSSPEERKQDYVVKFTLHAPWQINARCEYKMIFSELKSLWHCIHPENSDILNAEEVKMLYSSLIEHASQITSVDMQNMKISEVHYPDVTVRANGRFSCKTLTVLNELLAYFHSESFVADIMKRDSEGDSG